MSAKVNLNNGNVLTLDDHATRQVLKNIHEGKLNVSWVILNIADVSGAIKFTIPMTSVSHIEFFDDGVNLN